jgi:hypothetical protein
MSIVSQVKHGIDGDKSGCRKQKNCQRDRLQERIGRPATDNVIRPYNTAHGLCVFMRSGVYVSHVHVELRCLAGTAEITEPS